MKKVLFLMLAVSLCLDLAAQKQGEKHDPVGKWEFEAPTAPSGYNSGVIEVTGVEPKLLAVISFTGNDNKIPADQILREKDTVRISLNLDGTDIRIKMKFEEKDKMSGVATTYDGEIPLVLTRSKSK